MLIRSWIQARGTTDGDPYRSFALVFLFSVAAVTVYFLRDIGLCPVEPASVLSRLFHLCTLVGFTPAYVNHAERPTTFL